MVSRAAVNGKNHGPELSGPGTFCAVHGNARPLCRDCLLEHLAAFRHANLRSGLRLARERIETLRESYQEIGAAGLTAARVYADLTAVLTDLGRVDASVLHSSPEAMSAWQVVLRDSDPGERNGKNGTGKKGTRTDKRGRPQGVAVRPTVLLDTAVPASL